LARRSTGSGDEEAAAATKTSKTKVQLVDTKRSNNVAIALARIKLPDEEIKQCILDPEQHPLSAEQVSALINVLPTADELESVRDYQGEKEMLGRVEQFFLAIGAVERLAPRLTALQITLNFAQQAESLREELDEVLGACEQVKNSDALRDLLQRVLALGNYLNGTSFRGGAYGFKLADLSKLVQVKSADNKTTLLHYVAKLTASADDGQIEALKEQLSQLDPATGFSVSEKKGELGKLSKHFRQVQQEREACKEGDPFLVKLSSFVSQHEQGIKELEEKMAQMDKKLKDVAQWLGDKPTAGAEDLFSPISSFIKALDKAHKDNVREEAEARKREKAGASGGSWKKAGAGARGMAGGMPRPDGNMMLEMQLKMQQRWLANKVSEKKSDVDGGDGLGANLVDDAATGALFAMRRASAAGGISSKPPPPKKPMPPPLPE